MTISEARKRAEEIVAQMTVEEKASQLLYNSPAIERLGIREYNWWNEGSHGVARAGTATVFPHAIAMAATFHKELVHSIGDAISTEARVKYNRHVKYDDRDIYKGLTFWSPNINIFRDPRWGRGQETFGEDPYLTAALGIEYVRGIQGEGEFLKATACSKHFAVHSGPENSRHSFDAVVSDHDLFETYLPAFEKTVKAGVAGIMGAYNRTNGLPCCAHNQLIGEILRGQWGFEGYFTSDCGAISDIYKGHKTVDSFPEAAAMALKAGCELNCGEVYTHLMDAYESDLIEEEDITRAAVDLYTIRVRLGEFEEHRPYSDLPSDLLDGKAHRELNDRAARESLVLLQNRENFLPLGNFRGKMAVVGPNAMSTLALEGNYNGAASEYITVADGIRRAFPEADIRVEQGCRIAYERKNDWGGFANLFSDGVATAADADLTVLCLGLDRDVEGEENGHNDDFSVQGDKQSLGLPAVQKKLAEAVCDVCENVIVVLLCGSSLDVGEKVRNHAKAILYAWYPGARGGLAVADLLAGNYSPSGRLPITVYHETDVLPAFTDYAMAGRTYRYLTSAPLFPFGFGLSYTDIRYSDAQISSETEDRITVTAKITNNGSYDQQEPCQVYARFTDSRTVTPHFQLCGTDKVCVRAGETIAVSVEIEKYWIAAVLEDGSRVSPDGSITLFIGGHQPDDVSEKLAGNACCEIAYR